MPHSGTVHVNVIDKRGSSDWSVIFCCSRAAGEEVAMPDNGVLLPFVFHEEGVDEKALLRDPSVGRTLNDHPALFACSDREKEEDDERVARSVDEASSSTRDSIVQE